MASAYAMPPYQSNTHQPSTDYMPLSSEYAYIYDPATFSGGLSRYTSTPSNTIVPWPIPDSRYNSHMHLVGMMKGLPATVLPQMLPHLQQRQHSLPYQCYLGQYPGWLGAKERFDMTAAAGWDLRSTRVEGSEVRTDILLSTPGPPPDMACGSDFVPHKDADGKFPCPSCIKTYLHTKHLLRHMRRRKDFPQFASFGGN